MIFFLLQQCFVLFPSRFGQTWAKHCGALWLKTKRWHTSGVWGLVAHRKASGVATWANERLNRKDDWADDLIGPWLLGIRRMCGFKALFERASRFQMCLKGCLVNIKTCRVRIKNPSEFLLNVPLKRSRLTSCARRSVVLARGLCQISCRREPAHTRTHTHARAGSDF